MNLDLLENVLCGNTAEALEIMDELYRSGADPSVVVQDLLDLIIGQAKSNQSKIRKQLEELKKLQVGSKR